MHGADGRAAQVGIALFQAVLDLRGAPLGKLFFELDNAFLDLEGQLIGMAVRAPTTVGQALDAAVLVATVERHLIIELRRQPVLRRAVADRLISF